MNSERVTADQRPSECPKCGADTIAVIFYGLPHMTESLERQIEAGNLVLGGCVVSEDDPKWLCKSCGQEIYLTGTVDET